MHQLSNNDQQLVNAECMMRLMGVLKCEDHAAEIVQEPLP